MQTLYKADGTPINLLQDTDINLEYNYLKLFNGTLICWGKQSLDVSFTYLENGYRATVNTTIKFPMVFYDYPTIVINTGSDSAYDYSCVSGVERNRSEITRLAFDRLNKPSTNNVSIQWLAIGRWK